MVCKSWGSPINDMIHRLYADVFDAQPGDITRRTRLRWVARSRDIDYRVEPAELLLWAASKGYLSYVDRMFTSGDLVDANSATKPANVQGKNNGWTALHAACSGSKAQMEMIELLLQKGADPNKFDKNGKGWSTSYSLCHLT
jgi:ankyrin repeat protein